MSKFTVLGANGFIGGHLVRYLEAEGHDVAAPARDQSLAGRHLGHAIYCIGMTSDFPNDPVATVDAHIGRLNRLLAEAAMESLVYLSSTRLYDSGGPIGDELDDLVLNPATPRHLYDLTKAAAEALCHTIGKPTARVVRLASVYADDLGSDNFLHEVIRGALGARETDFDTSPDSARDYIHVDDVCRMIVAVATRGRRRLYNIASGRNVANRDLFAMVERETGCRVRALRGPAGGSAPRIKIDAAVEDLGFAPVQLAEALPGIVRAHAGPRRAVG
jgi:nucleoside-diphosphate-sugar epimerase